MFIKAILKAGVTPNLGGIKFAEDIVRAMDLDRAASADSSLQRFLGDLRYAFQSWGR